MRRARASPYCAARYVGRRGVRRMRKWRPDSSQHHPPSGPEVSRRAFLVGASTVGVMAAIEGRVAVAAPAGAAVDEAPVAGAVPITLKVNGRERRAAVDPRTTLLDCLRETLQLTGTKK